MADLVTVILPNTEFVTVTDNTRFGPQGTTGAQGLSGSFAGQGATGSQGAQGTQGTQGLSGQFAGQGIQGAQGIQGTQGPIRAFVFDGGGPLNNYSNGPAFDCGGVT